MLVLWGNGIGNSGARALLTSPRLKGLVRLALANNPIGPRLQADLREHFGARVELA